MLLAVIGAQWGDEGKGKIVDYLAKDYDFVVRFNGGNNAGHTVVIKNHKYPLSLVPSGVLHQKRLFISQGVVIDPIVLLKEIKLLKPRLTIDYRAHLVMPYHKLLDAATEAYKGKKKTGSLQLGIGYCYEDKNNRSGVRMEDLIDKKKLRQRIKLVFNLKRKTVKYVFGSRFNLKLNDVINEYYSYGLKFKKYVADVSKIISNSLDKKKILFEGAHGTFLDGVFGTYPYTVAIHTLSGSIFPYVGIPPVKMSILGTVKAYTTRVGNGPFATELFDQAGQSLRDRGGEYGTVSKRPRRCGWLDLDMITEAHRLNGFTQLAITKLDVLSGIKKIRVFSKRRYQTFSGWTEDISRIDKIEDLPRNCRRYLNFIEKTIRVPIKYISVGAERSRLIKV